MLKSILMLNQSISMLNQSISIISVFISYWHILGQQNKRTHQYFVGKSGDQALNFRPLVLQNELHALNFYIFFLNIKNFELNYNLTRGGCIAPHQRRQMVKDELCKYLIL